MFVIGQLSLSEAAIAYAGTLLYPDCMFDRVSTDSRSLMDGDLFVALQGENFDGHDFLGQVASRACGLVVTNPDKSINLPQWVVADTTIALGQLARLNRNRFEGIVVGLTGSTGKTTVKEMVARILGICGPVLATRGNLNNHIGVPKTLFELKQEHRYAVIEMGASGPGEIAYLGQMAKPDVALVNNVMPAHLEGFGSEAEIAQTKGAIYTSLRQSGTAVINMDESWAYKWQGMAEGAAIIGFSMKDEKADVGISSELELTGEGSRFVLRVNGRSRELFLPLPGRHNIANALAAAACAHAAGVGLNDIVAGLEGMEPVKGRGQIKLGVGGSTVIDDTYNANPGSVRAAIDVLAQREGKRVLVLGDMAELGSMTTKAHREAGEYARQKRIDLLFVCGQYREHSARGFGEKTRVFDTKSNLITALVSELDNQTTVLVKGSRSAVMEEVVAKIIEEGVHASLVG